MIIEGLLSVALVLAENTIQPALEPEPPPIVCYDDGEGGLTCHPIDLQEKGFK